MNVITTFKEKRQQKQMKYERSVLKDLSVTQLKERVQTYFGSFRLTSGLLMNAGIEEACYDVALEAYLLGANLSKFGYHGESPDDVKKRCYREEKHLIDTLYNFFLYWGSGDEGVLSESLYYLCEQYVHVWWMEGYQKGQKRHKLRLH
ncbi:YbaK family protein [Neobacillus sp. PS3-34]|uniref:YbaK family protein n=1 Tax=Neobacillus sp. PS3-34 TaxID=3070678 RepID=UPI0027DF5DD0|nr:YbaK family protein [Neobacillus sp. PS3-34]WML50258.1 YbaK family protein [Neobacillus sp. PS3-34]